MELEKMKLGNELYKQSSAIDIIIKKQNIGDVPSDGNYRFTNNSFFNIINVNNNGKGLSSHILISEFNDRSGANYTLSKDEVIELQEFIRSMLIRKSNLLVKQFNEL